ncbi:hypothetical protein GWI33_021961 [Rhynchophorus ferrugineus]|uniref:Uncharacterized protein n=1 Tax=Rhynchophorus ferrugineus TaxID=354439 RepID=A0A834MJD3_RHYFE|nr:hypothetical protein GWI33_021961 [Rhynchophorus ferrugineus]
MVKNCTVWMLKRKNQKILESCEKEAMYMELIRYVKIVKMVRLLRMERHNGSPLLPVKSIRERIATAPNISGNAKIKSSFIKKDIHRKHCTEGQKN